MRQGQPSLTFALGGEQMTRYLPTVRGWLALCFAVFASCGYPMLVPPRYVQSGGPTWLFEPVSPSLWLLGGLLLVTCVGSCIEAFRRGSRSDKVVACIAGLLTVSFIVGFFDLMLLRPAPNHRASLDAAGAVCLHSVHHQRGASERERSARTHRL